MAIFAFSKSISFFPGIPRRRKFAKFVLWVASSKERKSFFCNSDKETNKVRGSRWFPRSPKLPKPPGGMIPPNSLFMLTNLLSLSPERGASRLNRLGSSILSINLFPVSLFKRLPSRSLTKKVSLPQLENPFSIDSVPVGASFESGANFQNLGSTPRT